MTKDLFIRAKLAGLSPDDLERTILAPAFGAVGDGPPDVMTALPLLDANGLLMTCLKAERPHGEEAPAGPMAAVFAADPFLRLADLRFWLRGHGITRVTNLPSVQVYDGEMARALDALHCGLSMEMDFVSEMAAHGYEVTAFATATDTARAMLSAGARRIVLHPGVAVKDWRKCAAAASVLAQAAEALRPEAEAMGATLLLYRAQGFGALLDHAAARSHGCVHLAVPRQESEQPV
ncbi:phosphoenolpyruvate hydrolase family protein [Telmatospirillum sp. J64-1]|uniref:phosphoenolpyruvate hydrolase family protein n=1 Tax=Telmatospirillum sp. J64-1 TaxID=2502183 RepID=UPI00115E32B7|nr:phosphoenolpyruvate hydrolase family protein [Telmatospirillum sp. J64-1]